MKTIEIHKDIYDYLISRAASPGESLSAVLRRELNLGQPTESIEVDDDTYAYLLARASNFGESPSDILRRELRLGEQPHPEPNGVVVFHIPAGTGTAPWNSPETMLVAWTGNTLRIFNDDAVPHRLHTSGAPFPHPAMNIMPGQSADYLLESPFDPATSPPLYDHNSGPAAAFWLKVTPNHN
jgi:predicted CopG family antitoxin